MLQILRFNWPWYAAALALSLFLCAALSLTSLPAWTKGIALAAMVCANLWAVASLLVSHWIYDRSPLRKWDWIPRCVPGCQIRAVNIHAGFDETSAGLRRVFPCAALDVWDIYQPAVMTEPSILRAQRSHPLAVRAARVDLGELPVHNNTLDAAFLIFAAHEIRSATARTRFFGELFRILKPGGTILLVEHLRDWRNFLAFGPGFFHFLPFKEWLRLAGESGFGLADHFSITPFVSVFHLTKPQVL